MRVSAKKKKKTLITWFMQPAHFRKNCANNTSDRYMYKTERLTKETVGKTKINNRYLNE